jgi:hypothetical protein
MRSDTPTLNSEVSKKRAALEKRLSNIQQWAPAARERSRRASLRYTRLWKETKAKGEERYRALDEQLQALEVQGVVVLQKESRSCKLEHILLIERNMPHGHFHPVQMASFPS